MTLIEYMILGLLLKHFIIDFLLQTPFMYLNKGTYGHRGGLVHSWLHWVGTSLVLVLCGIPLGLSWALGALDFFAHYHIDWGKVKLTKYFELSPTNSEKYWWLLGLDQLLHQLTYLLIVRLVS
jgi:hypothetical protein